MFIYLFICGLLNNAVCGSQNVVQTGCNIAKKKSVTKQSWPGVRSFRNLEGIRKITRSLSQQYWLGFEPATFRIQIAR